MFKALEKRIRDIVEERDQGRWPLTRALLWTISMGYGCIVRLRAWLYSCGILAARRLPCKVIAIGNLTVGGTGKTPMTIHVARQLQQQGKRVAVISRGYKGAAEKRGGVVSDGRRILMGAVQSGDEPYMMAHRLQGVPVLVGQDRYRSGLTAMERFQPDVIILDDGYQHLRLHRDLNILLLDARKPFGNGSLLPRGRLREPLAAGRRADVIVFTRSQGGKREQRLPRGFPDKAPRHHADHRPVFYRVESTKGADADSIRGHLTPIEPGAVGGCTVYAFSGIADNDAFEGTLHKSGLTVKGFRSFGDHHAYSSHDQEELISLFKSSGADWMITTDKDYYRLDRGAMGTVPLMVVGIEISIEPELALDDGLAMPGPSE